MQFLNSLEAAGLLTAIEVVGDTAAKLGANDKRFFDGNNDLVTYGSYIALAYTLKQVLPRNSIAITNAYWNAMTNITHTLIGTLAFGETLSTQDYLGIGLITAGILLLRNAD